MKTLNFTVKLLEDVAISADGASTGGHKTLNYIPGIKFLGRVARDYDAFGNDAWNVFHSGRVQFGNAYPVHNGQRALPVPFSLTERKLEQGKQSFKGERSSFYLHSTLVRPRLARRQKTALDRRMRQAPKEGAFFEISAIAAEQSFAFTVKLDDIEQDVEERIVTNLTGEFALGRSRNAEFGWIRCSRDTDPPHVPETLSGDLVEVHALSDLDLSIEQARDPNTFGLAGDKWHRDSDFIRWRTVSSFNTHRQMRSLDRRVIEKGSVIVFRTDAPDRLSVEEERILKALAPVGVGAGRAEGLGEIRFTTDESARASLQEPKDAKTDRPEAPDCDLFRWADARASAAEGGELAAQRIRQEVPLFREHVENALREAQAAHKRLSDVGPGRAQWGILRDYAQENHASFDAFMDGLFAPSKDNHGAPQDRNPDAGLLMTGHAGRVWRFESDGQTFEKRLQKFLMDRSGDQPDRLSFARALLLGLGGFMQREIVLVEEEAAR